MNLSPSFREWANEFFVDIMRSNYIIRHHEVLCTPEVFRENGYTTAGFVRVNLLGDRYKFIVDRSGGPFAIATENARRLIFTWAEVTEKGSKSG